MRHLKYFSILLLFFITSYLQAQTTQDKTCIQGRPQNVGGVPSSHDTSCFVDGTTLIVHGVISHIVLNALKINSIEHVILNSPGGPTSTAEAIAQWIRDHNITTEVPYEAYCFSSCTLVFQSGVHRIASRDSLFLYHCVGLGLFGTKIVQQNCGPDPKNYSDKCQQDLDELVETTVLSTKKYFENFNAYGAVGIYEALLDTKDLTDWFETGNFCKKRMVLKAEETMQYSVVQELR